MTQRTKTRAAAKARPAPKPAKEGRATPQRRSNEPSAGQDSSPTGKAVSLPRAKPAKAAPSGKPKVAKPASKVPSSKSAAKGAAKTAGASKAGSTKIATSTRRAKTSAAAEAAGASGDSGRARRRGAGAPKAEASTPKAAVRSAAKPKPEKKLSAKAAKGTARTPRPRKAPRGPAYLAAELGQPVDREGEPIGAGSAMLGSDEALQEYALRLWRQMQSGGVVNRYMRAIERAGLTVDEVWTAGVIETRSTSSTADEMRRYKQKLLFRANLLEAILTETVADLHRLDGLVPSDAPGALSPPDAASGSS